MYNRHYRILASTALILILTAPLVSVAVSNSQTAAVPTLTPTEQALRLGAEPTNSADHDLGPPDLSDGLCRQRRKTADAA
jgi:hypothetical protein